MVEQNSKKISEALVRLGIKKTKLSEVLAISRPTLDKYIDVYDSGDRRTLPKRIHQSFLHISGYLEPENVDSYLSWMRNQYVIHDRRHCRPVSPVVVVDGLISPTDVLPPSFNEEEFLELSSRLSYKDTVSLIKALMASQCGDLTARYFGTDLPRPGTSYFEEKRWPVNDYFTFFFLNMLSEIEDDPLIRNSRYRDINCLRGYTDFALDCSMYPIESSCDKDPSIKINDLMQEIGYSKRDSESSWYFAAYFYPCQKYLPSPVEMVTDHFQAVDLEDAYAQALAIDSRDNPSYRAMSIQVFGPFDSLPEADEMESFVSIDWEGRYTFEHLPTVFGWLKGLSELRFFSFHTENISDLMHWVPFPEDFERFPEDTPDRFWPH